MLATLTDTPFSASDWIYERKFDGERVVAIKSENRVRLLSRGDKDLGRTYPEIVDALATENDDFVVDGEVVAFEGGRTSFARLQQRMQLSAASDVRTSGVAVYCYLFDVMHLDGYDLTGLPTRVRKNLLRRTLSWRAPLRYTGHRNTDGEKYLRLACERGWEGLIAKRADAAYTRSRSRDWLKFKCVAEQELVIGGFTDPAGSRTGIGALLVGYHEGDELRYAGKVGTGFDTATLRRLHDWLAGIERETSPFSERVRERGAHWVRPELVAEIVFTEWTTDGKLRHPRYQGLRRDKDPADVVRERATKVGT